MVWYTGVRILAWVSASIVGDSIVGDTMHMVKKYQREMYEIIS